MASSPRSAARVNETRSRTEARAGGAILVESGGMSRWYTAVGRRCQRPRTHSVRAPSASLGPSRRCSTDIAQANGHPSKPRDASRDAERRFSRRWHRPRHVGLAFRLNLSRAASGLASARPELAAAPPVLPASSLRGAHRGEHCHPGGGQATDRGRALDLQVGAAQREVAHRAGVAPEPALGDARIPWAWPRGLAQSGRGGASRGFGGGFPAYCASEHQ